MDILTDNGTVTHSVYRDMQICSILVSKPEEYLRDSTKTVRSFLERAFQSILTNHCKWE